MPRMATPGNLVPPRSPAPLPGSADSLRVLEKAPVALTAVLAVALALRVVGVGTGLPYSLGVDEPEILERVFRMMKTGNFNPNFFDWPSLLPSLLFTSGATARVWAFRMVKTASLAV